MTREILILMEHMVKKKTTLHMKFADEVHFCFRFTMIMKANIEEGMWYEKK